MKETLETLTNQISILEKESQHNSELNKYINSRVNDYNRDYFLKGLKLSLNILSLNAKKRAARVLFVYANNLRPLSFRLVSNDEIEMITHTNPHQLSIIQKAGRLTYYPEFTDRAEKLVNRIEKGELGKYLNLKIPEIVYMIMGQNGELLSEGDQDLTTYMVNTIKSSVKAVKKNLARAQLES